MDAMLVVDMQVGLLNGEPKHDLPGVIERINRLAAKVREQSGTVIFVQHCGRKGDDFEPQTPGWAFLPELRRDPNDVVVRKDLNDPFAGTDLQARLKEIAPDRVLITGWATDLCVDATVRSAVTHRQRHSSSSLDLERSYHAAVRQARWCERTAALICASEEFRVCILPSSLRNGFAVIA
jgi:nicotinamidase-related amidase